MLRKGLSIHSFEQNVPDEQLETAFTLMDDVALVPSPEGIKGLSLNHWTDATETEVLLQGSKIKDFHCSCGDFSRNHVCDHTLAMLLVIQKEKKQKQQKIQVRQNKPRQAGPSRNHLLQSIPYEALIDFVKRYATENRDFALRLKAAFPSLMEEGSSSNGFHELLESILKHIQANAKSWTARKSDKLAKYAEELLHKVAQDFADQNYRQAVAELFVLSEHILPIYFKEESSPALDKLVRDIFLLFRQTDTLDMAPALKAEFSAGVSSLVQQKWFLPKQKEENLFFLQCLLSIDIRVRRRIVQDKMTQTKEKRDRQAFICSASIYFSDHSDQAEYIIPEDPWSLTQWNQFLTSLDFEGKTSACAKGIKHVFETLLSSSIRNLAIYDLLKVLHYTTAQKALIPLIAAALLKDEEWKSWKLVSEELRENVLGAMLEQAEDLPSYEMAAGYAIRIQQEVKIKEYLLNEDRSIEAKIGLLPALSKEDISIRLPQLLHDISDFMQTYFGQKNIDKVLRMFDLLIVKNMQEEALQTLSYFQKQMPNRSLLWENIKEHYYPLYQSFQRRIKKSAEKV